MSQRKRTPKQTTIERFFVQEDYSCKSEQSREDLNLARERGFLLWSTGERDQRKMARVLGVPDRFIGFWVPQYEQDYIAKMESMATALLKSDVGLAIVSKHNEHRRSIEAMVDRAQKDVDEFDKGTALLDKALNTLSNTEDLAPDDVQNLIQLVRLKCQSVRARRDLTDEFRKSKELWDKVEGIRDHQETKLAKEKGFASTLAKGFASIEINKYESTLDDKRNAIDTTQETTEIDTVFAPIATEEEDDYGFD